MKEEEEKRKSIKTRAEQRKANAALQEILDGTIELENELLGMKASMSDPTKKRDDERRRLRSLIRDA